MSKWKCEICGMEFENFHAQGFEHKIYCPLCYFKELYRQTELERERLQNIIDELEIWLKDKVFNKGGSSIDIAIENHTYSKVLDRLEELKEGNKDE